MSFSEEEIFASADYFRMAVLFMRMMNWKSLADSLQDDR